jgi:hypothetical protein
VSITLHCYPLSGLSFTLEVSSISVDTPSEDEPESEEDESNPYPLEGKYTDEADRHRCDINPFVGVENMLTSMV